MDAALVHPNHASACNAQHPHIQGADIGPVSAYHRVINGRASVLDNADIGGGSTHLKIHAVGCPQVHKGSHNTGSRTGKHGQHRALLHLIDFHDAAISTHNHERHLHAGLSHALLRGIGRVQHLGQNAGVYGSCPGPSGQAVELGNVRDIGGQCRLKSHLVMGNLEHKLLPGNVVHPVSV